MTKKIDKINIKNFQIWEDAEIYLKNFNIIKGSSNSGKSAIVRAINMVMNNDWHKSWLRKNESKTTVVLYFNDGSHIKRTRGSINSVSIKTDKEKTWSGFGNNYPQEIVEFLNIGEENCSYQFDSHFFLSLSPTKRALTLGTFSDLKKIDDILEIIQKQLRNNDVTLKGSDALIAENKVELNEIKSTLKAKEAVDILKDVFDYNNNLKRLLSIKINLNEVCDELFAYEEISHLEELSEEYSSLYVLKEVFSLEEQIQSIELEIEKLEEEIKPEEKCPTCGQEIGEEHEKI